MKIVINRRFGGFGVSTAAVLRMRELGSTQAFPPATVLQGERYVDGGVCKTDFGTHGMADRTDPVLVRVVEEMGPAANGAYADLKIVDVPDGVAWEISEYDGLERVEEAHRSWS